MRQLIVEQILLTVDPIVKRGRKKMKMVDFSFPENVPSLPNAQGFFLTWITCSSAGCVFLVYLFFSLFHSLSLSIGDGST